MTIPQRLFLVLTAAALWPVLPVCAGGAPRPNGDFMVGLYNVTTEADMARAAADGFNTVHTYSYYSSSQPYYLTPDAYVQAAASHGLSVMFQIGVLTPSEPEAPLPDAVTIQHFSQYGNIAMWYLVPEEQKWNDPAQVQYMQDAYATIHANDAADRPVDMYLETGWSADDIQHYPPFLDAIGAGTYANYAGKPRPWVRWQIEQELQAISLAGDPPGRFALAIPQMFGPQSGGGPPMTLADAYHDAWLSVVAGARGVMVFSDSHRNDTPGVYDGYKQFAQQINDSNGMGHVFLDGEPINAVTTAITAGPQFSEAFTDVPNSSSGNVIQYPSITQRVMAYNGRIYLAGVNSAESSVTAAFGGIRYEGPEEAEVLYQNRQVAITNEALADNFSALGVNIYRLPAGAQLIAHEEPFDSASAWTAYHGTGHIDIDNGIATVHRGASPVEYFLSDLTPSSLPEGAFLELKVNAPVDTRFYLELVAPDGSTRAVIDWQYGLGQWQTLAAPFDGDWRGGSALWLGISGGGALDASYQLDSLGIYFAAVPEPAGGIFILAAALLLLRPISIRAHNRRGVVGG